MIAALAGTATPLRSCWPSGQPVPLHPWLRSVWSARLALPSNSTTIVAEDESGLVGLRARLLRRRPVGQLHREPARHPRPSAEWHRSDAADLCCRGRCRASDGPGPCICGCSSRTLPRGVSIGPWVAPASKERASHLGRCSGAAYEHRVDVDALGTGRLGMFLGSSCWRIMSSARRSSRSCWPVLGDRHMAAGPHFCGKGSHQGCPVLRTPKSVEPVDTQSVKPSHVVIC